MGIEDVTGESCPELAGTTDSGYRFVYYNFDGKPLEPDFYRIRRHEMPSTPKFGAKPVKTDCPKYLQPAGSGVHAYLSRRIDWNADVLADQHQTIPVIFTEGEKKAEAACKAGLITVGLGGVDAFASSKQDIDLLPDLAKLAKNRRSGLFTTRTSPTKMTCAVRAKSSRCKFIWLWLSGVHRSAQ